jgi:GAF domain-containing protein
MALLAVPLVAGERLLGVILLARTLPFATSDLRTLLTLSQLVAQAFDRMEITGSDADVRETPSGGKAP